MRCDHDFEVESVMQVVGWDEDDSAIPCVLEINKCNKCGMLDESITEGMSLDDSDIWELNQ